MVLAFLAGVCGRHLLLRASWYARSLTRMTQSLMMRASRLQKTEIVHRLVQIFSL